MKMEELQGKTLAGRFRLDKRLGEGGYGAVFEATQLSVGRRCAVKVLFPHLCEDDATVDRFRAEAKMTSRLTHPNSVILYDFGRDEDLGLLFLAMELLDGKDLRSMIREQGHLSVERTVHIIDQAAQSLQEAHGLGLVHRDIKPHNIMIVERGGDSAFVKVIDFGIAKVVRAGVLTVGEMTQTGTVIGTPKYMAPEQIRDSGIDERTDMYGLAITAYQMLTGRTPFEEGTAMEIAGRQLAERPKPLRAFHPGLQVSEEFEQVLLKALEKKSQDRYETVTEFADALTSAARKPVNTPASTSASTQLPQVAVSPVEPVAPEEPLADGVIDDYVELTQGPDAGLFAGDVDASMSGAFDELDDIASPEELTSTSVSFEARASKKTMATMAVPNPARPGLGGESQSEETTGTAEMARADGGDDGAQSDGIDHEDTEREVTLTAEGGPAARSTPVLWIAIAAVVVLGGLGAWFLSASGSSETADSQAEASQAEASVDDGDDSRQEPALAAKEGPADEKTGDESDDDLEEQVPKGLELADESPEPTSAGEERPEDVEADNEAPEALTKTDSPPAEAAKPSTEPTTEPRYGAVEVRVIPWGILYVDGRKIGGGTRHKLRLRTGRRRLVLKQSGEVRARRTVDVSARSSKIIELVAK